MDAFIQKYQKNVTGVLSGWDRLRIRGTQRALANVAGMMSYLSYMGNFGAFVERTCLQVRQTSEQVARQLDRPVQYLCSSAIDKQAEAEKIARQDRIKEGLVCVFSCVEPCRAYRVQPDRAAKQLTLRMALRKCVHLYHYWMDKDFGLMHARLQSWFPFTLEVCLNGRSWLARQMDKQGLGYPQQENCFTWLEDVRASQKLMDQLLRLRWLFQPGCHALPGQEAQRAFQGPSRQFLSASSGGRASQAQRTEQFGQDVRQARQSPSDRDDHEPPIQLQGLPPKRKRPERITAMAVLTQRGRRCPPTGRNLSGGQ